MDDQSLKHLRDTAGQRSWAINDEKDSDLSQSD